MRSFRQLASRIKDPRRYYWRGADGQGARHGSADIPHDSSSSDWYFDVSKSGGYLIEMSVHNLDACNWAIGSRPERAAGFGGIQLYKNDPPGRTIFDCGVLSYDYANGVKMSFTRECLSSKADAEWKPVHSRVRLQRRCRPHVLHCNVSVGVRRRNDHTRSERR